MTKTIVATFLVLATATGAHAQSAAKPQAGTAFEITPYFSIGSAGESGAGAAVRWPIGSLFSIEVEAGYRRAEINALYSNAGVLFDLPSIGRVTPYLAAGIGLGQYGFAEMSPAGTPVSQSAATLSVNAGGGVRVPVTENWGVRADARWQNGLGGRAPERWRVFNGVSYRRGR
jgi:hypothetical protein